MRKIPNRNCSRNKKTAYTKRAPEMRLFLCRVTDLNCGPCDFQSHALTTELTRRGSSILIVDDGTVNQKGLFDTANCAEIN